METKTLKAIGYARVSTDKQESEGVSLKSQTEKIRAMALIHGVELELIIDGGQSAKNLDRPGMERLLALVDSGSVGMVIIAKLDRMTRSVANLAELLERFAKRGVSLVSVAESLDTGSASGRLVLNLMTAVSQFEREAISERTKDAMAYKKANNERVGTIPFGFKIAVDGVHLERDINEQAILAKMRDLRLHFRTYRQIAEDLNLLGFKTRKQTSWRLRYVCAALQNAA